MSTKAKANPTMQDVARRAGVSASTVSFVVSGRKNGKSRISPETAERVRKAIKDLNYVPSQFARQLRTQATRRVCLVLPHLRPYDNALIKQLNSSAVEHGYSAIVNVSAGETETLRILKQLRAGLADACMLLLDHSNVGSRAIAEELTLAVATDIPIVIMSDSDFPKHDVVVSTVEQASFEATCYLLGQNRMRIGFVGHTLEPQHYPRLQGFLRALEESGVEPNPQLMATGAASYEEGLQAAQTLIAERPDALLCASDIAAISALSILQRKGLSVPQDVAVIGMGNVPESAVSTPTLTTIGPQTLDFSAATNLLFKRLQYKEEKSKPERLEQRWDLIKRASA